MDDYATHIIDLIVKKKGLFINTTGREPTYIIMNKYTYQELIGQSARLALTTDPTLTFDSLVGLPVAILPMDKRKEIYVETV